MLDDENYNQTKKVRDTIKSWLESGNFTSEEQRKGREHILAIANAMLELQALPEDAPEKEFRAKTAVVAELQQKGLDLGFLVPGPSKGNTAEGTD